LRIAGLVLDFGLLLLNKGIGLHVSRVLDLVLRHSEIILHLEVVGSARYRHIDLSVLWDLESALHNTSELLVVTHGVHCEGTSAGNVDIPPTAICAEVTPRFGLTHPVYVNKFQRLVSVVGELQFDLCVTGTRLEKWHDLCSFFTSGGEHALFTKVCNTCRSFYFRSVF